MQNLVLIPGLGSDGVVWARTIDALGNDARCIVGDTLYDDTLAGMARRIVSSAPPTFCLAGVSMGGMVALEIMRTVPERVCGLALVDTNARPDTDDQAARRRAINAAIRKAGSLLAAGGSNIDYLVHRGAPDDVRRDLTEMGVRVGAEVYVRQNDALLARGDLRPILATIAVPCVVVVGEEDQMTPPPLSEEIHHGIVGSEFHRIPACGHLPPIEKPLVVADILRGLLSRSVRFEADRS